MSYEPAFFEIFLGLVLIMVWARFVQNRGGPLAARWVPWGVGIVLLGGQLIAVYGVLGAIGAGRDLSIVSTGRLVSVAAPGIGALTLVVMTVQAFVRPRTDDQVSDEP